jgi:hypothetical protein
MDKYKQTYIKYKKKIFGNCNYNGNANLGNDINKGYIFNIIKSSSLFIKF